MDRSNEVVEFINRRFKGDSHWCDGNCYYFAQILIMRFPHLKLYYEPIQGHFYAGIGMAFFDWTGMVQPENEPILFTDLMSEDPNWARRIMYDCAN